MFASPLVRLCLLLTPFCLAPPDSCAIPSWSIEYAVEPTGDQPPDFEFGWIVPSHVSGESGHTLRGLSELGAVTNLNFVPSAARFDHTGQLLWSVFLPPPFVPGSAALEASLFNRDLVYAGFVTNGTARIGLIHATNIALQVFGLELPLAGPAENARVHLQLGPVVALSEDLGTNVQVSVFSNVGETLFHKKYNSPFFTPLESGLEGSETVELLRLPDGSAYLMVVHRSIAITNAAIPTSVIYSNNVITTCLNTNGSVRWSHADTLLSLTRTTPISNMLPDGSLLYSLRDLLFNFSTFQYVFQTHLWMVAADGSIVWSHTLPNAQLVASHGFDTTNAWAVGSFHADGTFASDLALARIDPGDGSILTQVIMDAQEFDQGQLTGVFNSRVYFTMDSFEGTNYQNQTGRVGYLDLNLQNPSVRRYLHTVRGSSLLLRDATESSLIYSTVRSGLHAIGAIAMDWDFVPGTACALFASSSVNITTNFLITTNLAMTRQDPMLTTGDLPTSSTPVSLSLGVLNLTSTNLCTGLDLTKPILSIAASVGDLTFNLRFQSQTNVTYTIQISPSPNGGFSAIGSVAGTGELIQYSLPAVSADSFCRVMAIPE